MPDTKQYPDHYSGQYPSRKPLRLQDYDYSQPGYYFITICTQNQKLWLGNIADGEMKLNSVGRIVQMEWTSLPDCYSGVELDQFVIMPNHMHGILILGEEVQYHHAQKRLKSTVSNIISRFKGSSTYRIQKAGTYGFAWQKSFYDSIIRHHTMLDTIRCYIVDNPARWSEDKLYMSNDLPH